jgi:tRNA threonylcarbamoyl adenosine modification protein YeaZ
MRVLFIDLASHSGLLACVTEESVIASEPVDHRIGDHELIPLLEKVLKRAQWSYQDLTQIACVTGPGGFTSLRVAVALANTLVHQLKIPGTGVHLSDLYFARISPHPPLDSATGGLDHRGSARGTPFHPMGEGRVRDVLWVHSTKKHELFVRGFGEYAKQWPEAAHVMLEEVPKGAQWIGELIPEHEKILQMKGSALAAVKTVEEVLPEFLAKRSFILGLLEPWYGREG